MPTLKIVSSDWAGWNRWNIFRTIFARISEASILSGQSSSMCKLCLACLLNFAEQASWVKLVQKGGLSYQKIKKGYFSYDWTIKFWESAVKIRNLVGHSYNTSFSSTWFTMYYFSQGFHKYKCLDVVGTPNISFSLYHYWYLYA